MLLEGVRLMVVGMTTVFAFLSVLVLAMQGTRVIAAAWGGSEGPEETGDLAQDDQDRDVAVVLAVIAATRGER